MACNTLYMRPKSPDLELKANLGDPSDLVIYTLSIYILDSDVHGKIF